VDTAFFCGATAQITPNQPHYWSVYRYTSHTFRHTHSW